MFLVINTRTKTMYWENKVNIFNCLNKSLQDSRLHLLVIILIALFCTLKMSPQIAELPQNITPYFNRELK